MDIRSQFVKDFLSLVGYMEYDIKNQIENALIITLDKYELQNRCTDIVESQQQTDYLTMYLTTLRIEGKSEKTLEQYKLRLSQMLDFLGKEIHDITLYDLRFFLACYKRARKISNGTMDTIRRYIRAFFAWLSTEGHITSNPALALKPIKQDRQIKKEYSQVELELIHNACQTKRELALTEILYATGARVSEISQLNIEDVNLNTLEIKVFGKGRKERIVYITEKCAMYLQDYLNSRVDERQALFVYERAPYNRLQKSGIERVLKNLGERSGVENVHPHRYRRTMATNLINRGCAIQNVQKILGHSSIETTQIYYVHNADIVKASYKKYAA